MNLELRDHVMRAIQFDYILLTKSLLQNALADIGMFFLRQMHLWFVSLISHKPIAGERGAMKLFVGSYQFLQKAHFLISLILTVTDPINTLSP